MAKAWPRSGCHDLLPQGWGTGRRWGNSSAAAGGRHAAGAASRRRSQADRRPPARSKRSGAFATAVIGTSRTVVDRAPSGVSHRRSCRPDHADFGRVDKRFTGHAPVGRAFDPAARRCVLSATALRGESPSARQRAEGTSMRGGRRGWRRIAASPLRSAHHSAAAAWVAGEADAAAADSGFEAEAFVCTSCGPCGETAAWVAATARASSSRRG